MISTRSLAKPPRKRNTIDVKASMNHNTTFQHPETLESDSDKPVSLAGDSAGRVPFYPYCQLHVLPLMTRYWLPFKTCNRAEEGWKGFLVRFWMSKLRNSSPLVCLVEFPPHLDIRELLAGLIFIISLLVWELCRTLSKMQISGINQNLSLVSWADCRNLCL